MPSAQGVHQLLIFPSRMPFHVCPQSVLCHQFANPVLGANCTGLSVSLLATGSANPQQAKHHGSIGVCSDRYQRLNRLNLFQSKLKITINNESFCRVSLENDPFHIRLGVTRVQIRRHHISISAAVTFSTVHPHLLEIISRVH